MVKNISANKPQYDFAANVVSKPVLRDNTRVFPVPQTYIPSEIEQPQNLIEANLMDEINAYFNEISPEEVQKWVPEQYLKMGDSSLYCCRNNVEAYNEIPRSSDGKIDTAQIKEALGKAIEMIKAQNEQALQQMSYGIYKEAINSTDLLTGFLGFELAQVVKETAEATDTELPAFLTTGVSLFQLTSVIAKGADALTEHVGGNAWAEDLLGVKTKEQIKADIEKQNAALDKLANFDIDSEESIKEFLDSYFEITGTTFSCERIEDCYELKQGTVNSTNGERVQAYAASCGSSSNYVNAMKNEIVTNVAYNVVMRTVLPTVLYNIPTPPTKIIGVCLPTYVDLMETATQGCNEGSMINADNLKDYENITDIIASGSIQGGLVALFASGAGQEMCSNSKFMDLLFGRAKGTLTNNIFTKLGVKIVRNVSLKNIVSTAVKFFIPDYSADDAFWRYICPTYAHFKAYRENCPKWLNELENKVINSFTGKNNDSVEKPASVEPVGKNRGQVIPSTEPNVSNIVITTGGKEVVIPAKPNTTIKVKALDEGKYMITTSPVDDATSLPEVRIVSERELVSEFSGKTKTLNFNA